MKHSLRCLFGVFCGCVLVSLAGAQDPGWTTTSLDPCGYVPAIDVVPRSPTTAQRKALTDLRAGRNVQAWVAFRELYRKDDDSPLHIWGMAISALKAGKLAAASDEVDSRASMVRQKEIERGGGRTPPRGTARHIVAFNLIRSMARVGELSALSARWSSTLLLEPLPAGEKRREMIILYSAAMSGMNEHGKARKWLRAFVDSHPKEARGRLLLASSYSQGVVKLVDGRGRELPVPPEDRMIPSLAKKYAAEAARLEPNWAEAQYVAGREHVSESPRVATEFLARYLKLDKNPPKLRMAVIDQFMKTGKWGPPPP